MRHGVTPGTSRVTAGRSKVAGWTRVSASRERAVRETGGLSHPDAQGDVPVLVVDDQDVFRAVMRDVVQATPGMTLAGEAASGEEAIALADERSPRLVLMDKRMPGMGGVAAARAIGDRHPDAVIVLVSVEDPDTELRETSGACAFLRKRDLSRATLTELWRDYGSP
jgi:CheY-like chemotaxis protein